MLSSTFIKFEPTQILMKVDVLENASVLHFVAAGSTMSCNCLTVLSILGKEMARNTFQNIQCNSQATLAIVSPGHVS